MTTTRNFDLTGLSEAERLLLAGELLETAHSFREPLTAAQLAELERRDAAAEAGLVTGIPWEEVRASLKSGEWQPR